MAQAIERTHALLDLPDDYRLGIVPASDTGAMEMALWSLLGPRPVTMLAWESFGAGWVTDVVKQLKLNADVRTADYGQISDLRGIDPANDLVFTWNGTTSGVRVPDADWISADRTGLSICDATSAAFAQDVDWAKVDVGTFSWQKALGGEGGHGMLVLSPRAVERLERDPSPRPLPKIFRLTKGGKLIDGIFNGETINTPSMLAVEDWLVALDWAERAGGLQALIARADSNAAALNDWVEGAGWIEHLSPDPAIRSTTSVCLQFTDRSDADASTARQKAITKLLEQEGAAFDIGAYRDAPPGLRIWCGATVDTADIEALAAVAQASEGARQQAQVIMPENARQRQMQEEIGWADAVVSNGIVYVSGVPAYLAPGETDTEKAYTRAFEALGATLKRAGVTWDDVVSMTTYHIDPNAQIETFAKVKARYMRSPPPKWSAIGTTALLQPGGLVEIELIAHKPRAK